ncbi:MAG: alkaline phosphatase D family protein [Candidatus Synoicihabitans palmerolidicus]|nr:alkaline phosphatase D family protein [Candidatus Synoicihabitans palmerolidicus]
MSGRVDDHGIDQEPNNVRAIESLSIYRSFRFGRHVELVVTDTRSHRSDHPVPAELNQQISGSARYVTPWEIIKIFDVGRTFNGGNPPAEIPFGGKTIPNVRHDSPAGSMLGSTQKAWFKDIMRRSDATWKRWGNSLPLQPLRLDFHHLDPAKGAELAFTTDCWDGFPS